MLELTYLQLASVVFVSYTAGVIVCAFLAWLLFKIDGKENLNGKRT